jgi:hypothetical protein
MKSLVWAPLLALVIWVGAGNANAADKNKCGCYKDGSGVCFCDKKAKCGCPGDCEPKGCDAAREKQIQKEIEAETKKAAEADRKHKATAASETKMVSTRTAKNDGDNGDNGKAAPAGQKLSPAQTKQLAKLLDSYLKAHPGERSKNVEELRNELTLTPR